MVRYTNRLVFALLNLALIASSQNAPTAHLGYVSYAGYQNTTIGINYYRAIPYAQPPVGQRRWRAPLPIESHHNFGGKTLNATEIGPSCYQSLPASILSLFPGGIAGLTSGLTQSEDCLILDVLTPTTLTSNELAVLLEIHGGGYTFGNAGSYPGDALVNVSNGNLIFVSIQYRLGLFGFLGGNEIAKDGSLNAGLLDQRLAVEWVQRHIGAFGGNPSRITIWGGSAGGGSVAYQLIAHGGQGTPPFSAAIAEYPWIQPPLNKTTQERQFSYALALSNCTDLKCLRSKSSATLGVVNQAVQEAAYPGPGDGYGLFYYGPVVDGTFVKNLPSLEFFSGNFYKVPLLVDHDVYEGFLFTNMSTTSQDYETSDAEELFPFAGPSFFSRLYDLYPPSAFNSTFFQRQTWFGDFIISCPTYYMATSMTDYSYNQSAVFKLTFAAGTQLHGATSPFLSSTDPSFPQAMNHTLAEIMSNYWISFALAHDPNPFRAPNAPFWPSYSSGGAGTVANGESVGFDVLGVTSASIEVTSDPDASAKCDFFGSRAFQVRN